MSKKRDPVRSPPVSLLVASLAGALALIACTESDKPGPTSPPLLTAIPASPARPQETATPAPADPALGRLHQRNGEYDEAIAVFQAVVASADEPERGEARLSLALTYLDSDLPQEALSEIDAFLGSAPPADDVSRARFLRARALAALDRPAEALEEYDRYLDTAGPAASYARLGRAQALALLGRADEAAVETEIALAQDLPSAARARALLLVAQSLEQAGDLLSARDWYGRLVLESDSLSDQALGRWRQAVLSRLAGDPSWADAAREVLAAYPSTASALEALEALRELGEPVDGYRAGLVLYRHFQDRDAIDTLQENLALPSPSSPAESFYYLAAAQERLGDIDAALQSYQRSLAEDPLSGLADDAAWWCARVLETAGRLDEAESAYADLVLNYAGSRWAPDARFRRGLVRYKQGRFDEALAAWLPSLDSNLPAIERSRTLLWLAKVETMRGNDDAAQDYADQLSLLANSYFSIRAAALLSGDSSEAPPVDITVTPPDWSAADVWAAAFDTTPALPFDPTADPRWIRAGELLGLGLYDSAQTEFDALLSAHASNPRQLYSLARAFDDLNQVHLASRAATLLLDQLPAATADAAPVAIWRLAYPAAFASLVEATSGSEGVPPELMLALIRQESFFNPRAGSVAGALGLTQVIPSTGMAIAEDLGLEHEFEVQDLMRPSVSIRFGAYYLKRQLEQFDDNVAEALAAYNGGPSNARRWSDLAGGDPDLFLEEIDLSETRAYVRLVSENLARYRQLYGSPALDTSASDEITR